MIGTILSEGNQTNYSEVYEPGHLPTPGLYQAVRTTYPGYGVSPAVMSGIVAAEALLATGETASVPR